MEFVKVAQTSELTVGDKKKIVLDNREILLVNIQGTYFAIDNKCPHMGGSLYDGKLEKNNIVCPKHGATFDVRTGKAVQGAKMLFVKIKVNDVHSFPVKVEGNDVLLGIE